MLPFRKPPPRKGVPVAASTGTPWKCLEEERCGWWIANDVNSLSHVLKQAAALAPGERIEMGCRGQRMVRERFSAGKTASQWIAVCRWLLEGGLPPAEVHEE